jgi:hypothetical protein
MGHGQYGQGCERRKRFLFVCKVRFIRIEKPRQNTEKTRVLVPSGAEGFTGSDCCLYTPAVDYSGDKIYIIIIKHL